MRTGVVLSAVLIASCSPRPVALILDTDATHARTVIENVRRETDRIKTLVGRGTLSFESPEIAGTAAFEMSLKKPDSLLIRLEGPFGVDVATVFLSRDSYLVYNGMENRVLRGSPSDPEIRRALPFDLAFDQILSSFAGAFPLPDDDSALLSYSIDDGRFLLTYRCGDGTCKYWVDPSYRLVTRVERQDASGNVDFLGSASSLTLEQSISIPMRMTARFPLQGRRISVQYTSVTMNPPTPSFAFSIPANARPLLR